MERLAGVDGVIVNGEGSIHHSATNARAHYLTELAKTVKKYHDLPVHLINASLFALEDDVFENLRHFDSCYVRESCSSRLLAEQNICCSVVPDLTLTVQSPGVAVPSTDILVTDSVISTVAKELKAIAAEKRWHYTKLTHASWPLHADGWPVREYLRRGGKWFYAALVGRNRKNRFAFLDHLKSHGLLCTGRFHAATLALVTGTPFLAIESNTPKISCLLHDVFGSTERLVDVSRVRTVHCALDHAWNKEELARISAYGAMAKIGVAKMFDAINHSLGQK